MTNLLESSTHATAPTSAVAFVPRFLVASELDSGELAVALEQPLRSSFGYYLVTPVDKIGYAPVVAFREWLLQTVSSP